MRRSLAALVALLGACASIDHENVEGWPQLHVAEHYVSAAEMVERCRKYVGFGSLPLACAEFNLAAGRCDIWLNRSFAPQAVREPPSHAQQWEALLSSGLWAAWEEWKRRLVAINVEEALRAEAEPFPLWDFSGYTALTTEPFPALGDVDTKMRWYWESSHYKKELGRLDARSGIRLRGSRA